jgi:hypothetical protein
MTVRTFSFIYFEAVGQLFRVDVNTDKVYYKEYGKWVPMKEDI